MFSRSGGSWRCVGALLLFSIPLPWDEYQLWGDVERVVLAGSSGDVAVEHEESSDDLI